jgi:hypothetical protein
MRALRLFCFVTLLLLSLRTSAGAAPSYTLDLAAAPLQEVPMVVTAPTTIHFRIFRTGDEAASAMLDLTDFTNEQGLVLPVHCRIAGTQGGDCAHLADSVLQSPVIPVELDVPAFPGGGKFSGGLILSTTGTNTAGAGAANAVFVWRFVLSSADDVRPAMLRAEPAGATALQAVRAWCLPFVHWCGGDTPIATVSISDKTLSWPLHGVLAGFEGSQAVSGPGLDPVPHVSAQFNGKPAPGIFSAGAASTFDVPKGQAALITFQFNNLAPGAYNFPLRFAAANSAFGDDQKVDITLQIRNPWFTAIPVLILGAIVSFGATRIVVMLQRRASFIQRLHAMQPSWLADEPPILPVIGLRAALRQTEDLSNRFWVTGQTEIGARLDAAGLLLGVLDRVRQIRTRMHIDDQFIMQRAQWKLGGIVDSIGAGPLTAADAAALNAQLDDLMRWADPAQREACYWADLKTKIAAKCAVVRPDAMPTSEAREHVKTLLDQLNAVQQTEPNLQGKHDAEINYGRLSILWELRAEAALVTKVLETPRTDIEAVRRIVNDHWWSKLKENAANITIQPPDGDIQAYDIITLNVHATDNAELRDSYLVHQKISWHWKITTLPRQRRGARPDVQPPTEIISWEPRIAQYARRPGTLKAEVRLTYNGVDSIVVRHACTVPIGASDDFGSWRIFEMSDLISTLLALIVSVGSGIALYAFAPTFGSVKDYFALLTWAAGLDQGKNFLQSLAVYATPAKPGS